MCKENDYCNINHNEAKKIAHIRDIGNLADYWKRSPKDIHQSILQKHLEVRRSKDPLFFQSEKLTYSEKITAEQEAANNKALIDAAKNAYAANSEYQKHLLNFPNAPLHAKQVDRLKTALKLHTDTPETISFELDGENQTFLPWLQKKAKKKNAKDETFEFTLNGKDKNPFAPVSGAAHLDKLALLRKISPLSTKTFQFADKHVDIQLDECTEISDETKKVLKKRAAAKFHTLQYLPSLIELNSNLRNSYCNSITCAESIINKDGKLISAYCKNRWCVVCCRIKTANLIKGYQPQIELMENPQFITHTFRNCEAAELPKNLARYSEFFREHYNYLSDELKKIKSRLATAKRKRLKDEILQIETELQQFTNVRKLRGIRKIECTYNPTSNTYHPHTHIVVANEVQAKELNQAWFKYCERENLVYNPQAQKTVKCNANISKELFKYFTKMMTPTNKVLKIKKKKEKSVWSETEKRKEKLYHIQAMDIIFAAMVNKQVFTAFGIKKVEEDDVNANIESALTEMDAWMYDKQLHDWVNTETGEVLTNYSPSEWELQLKTKIVKPHIPGKLYNIAFTETMYDDVGDIHRFYVHGKITYDQLTEEINAIFNKTP
jgi:hypothetical protein